MNNLFARTAALALGCLMLAATAAAAKTYHADRFDVHVQVRDDGSLFVTETIVFVFESGTFSTVFRKVPARRTDGLHFVDASMDGRRFPRGKGAGEVNVTWQSGLRVEWRFEPVSGARHTFQLTYLALGVVTQQDEADVLAWRALPTEHAYRIGTSTIRIAAPAAPLGSPTLASRRVDGNLTAAIDDGRLVIEAASIRRNGWIEPHIRYAKGALVSGAPAWQQRQAQHRAMASTWMAAAAGVVLIGLVLLIALRQSYDSPPASTGVQWTSLIPPDPLPPVIAATLVSNGDPRLEHAMAAFFELAERGILAIREEPRGTFGSRSFTVTRTSKRDHLAPYESVLLDIIFSKSAGSDVVSLARARSNLMHQFKKFKNAVYEDLHNRGLLDEPRKAHRRRYLVLGVLFLGLAIAAAGACVAVRDQFGAWPLLVPGAFVLVSLASFIFASAETPLSNEGVRSAEVWRAYRRHLRHPQQIEPRWGASTPAEARMLPVVVALGLAGVWSSFMKKRHTEVPEWFSAASHHDSGHAFAAFLATGGSGGHGAGGASGGGGGGAAGGGGSGAG